jgi:hypothetical protein
MEWIGRFEIVSRSDKGDVMASLRGAGGVSRRVGKCDV